MKQEYERIPFEIGLLKNIENDDWWLETKDGRDVSYEDFDEDVNNEYPLKVRVNIKGSGMHVFYYSVDGKRKDDAGKDNRWNLVMVHPIHDPIKYIAERFASDNAPKYPDVSWDDLYEKMVEAYEAGYKDGQRAEADKYTYEGYGNYRRNSD